MLPDRVSNPGPLTYESGALPIALRGPARYQSYRADMISIRKITKGNNSEKNVGGATVDNLCMPSGHALHVCQVS